jgi:hypothetical protein
VSSVRLLLDTADTVGEPRTGPRRFWTGREEMILRNAYPVGGLPDCLEKLPGRSAKSIYQRAGLLGLQSPGEATRGTPRQHHATNDYIDGLIARTYQNNPDTGAIKKLARTIDRPRSWIRSRAVKLGCALPRFKSPPWVAAENEIIAENAHLGPAALQRRLVRAGYQRTETAIVVQLKRLGASTEDPDHYSARGLAVLFGVDVKVVTGWILKGWLKAAKRGTARTEQQGGDEWWISRRQVRRFVVESVQVIDFRKLDKVWLIDLLTRAFVGRTDGDGSRGRPRGSTGRPVFMPIHRPKGRLDEELAQEVAKDLRHWLNDLGEADSARVFTVIRQHNQKMKLFERASIQARQDGSIGAAHFDGTMQVEVRRDFLAAVRTGSTPEDAADIAKKAAESSVAKHNARRPDDMAWQRISGMYVPIADFLMTSIRAVLQPR